MVYVDKNAQIFYLASVLRKAAHRISDLDPPLNIQHSNIEELQLVWSFHDKRMIFTYNSAVVWTVCKVPITWCNLL